MALTTGQQKFAYGALIFLGIIIAAAVVYYVWFRDECDPSNNGFTKKGKPSDKCRVADPVVANVPPPAGCTWIPDSSFPLKKCMWGSRVKALQAKLGIGDDGQFGNDTLAAVQKKFNSPEVTEAQYNNLISPAPAPPPAPIGGSNFNTVKKDLGSAGSTANCTGCVYTNSEGKNTTYIITFYTNGRVRVYDNNKKTFRMGTYIDGGKEIVIDKKDGGYASGNYISNDNVLESIKDIIEQIED